MSTWGSYFMDALGLDEEENGDEHTSSTTVQDTTPSPPKKKLREKGSPTTTTTAREEEVAEEDTFSLWNAATSTLATIQTGSAELYSELKSDLSEFKEALMQDSQELAAQMDIAGGEADGVAIPPAARPRVPQASSSDAEVSSSQLPSVVDLLQESLVDMFSMGLSDELETSKQQQQQQQQAASHRKKPLATIRETDQALAEATARGLANIQQSVEEEVVDQRDMDLDEAKTVAVTADTLEEADEEEERSNPSDSEQEDESEQEEETTASTPAQINTGLDEQGPLFSKSTPLPSPSTTEYDSEDSNLVLLSSKAINSASEGEQTASSEDEDEAEVTIGGLADDANAEDWEWD